MPKHKSELAPKKFNIPAEDIIALLPGNVYWLDRNGIFLGCNNNMLRMVGLKSIDKHIGKTYEDLYKHSHIQIIKQTDQKIMRENRSIILEETALTEGKKPTTYLTKKEPLYDTSGNIIGLLGLSIDITAHKRTKKKLLENQHMLYTMIVSMAHDQASKSMVSPKIMKK